MAADPATHQAEIAAAKSPRGAVVGARVVVAVRDPDGEPFLASQPQHVAAEMMHVTVNDAVRPMLAEQPPKGVAIADRPTHVRAAEDPAAAFEELRVVGGRFVGVHQDIGADARLLEPANEMHEPRLDAAAVHRPDDMEHADRLGGSSGDVHSGALLRMPRAKSAARPTS